MNRLKIFRPFSLALLVGLMGASAWGGSSSLGLWTSATEPLDTSGIDWLFELPLDRWQKINDKEAGVERVRWLFNSIVHQGRIQMALEAQGGTFERTAHRRIFYFHPEYEYFFPPYDRQGVKWPVWVKRKSVPEGRPYDGYFVIHLGRREDDERDIYIKFQGRELYDFKVIRWRKLPGVEGPPKVEELKMKFFDDEVRFTRTYYNDNRSWEIYRQEELMVFEQGNPEPVVDRLSGEPELEITGVEDMFTLPVDDWEVADGFWYFRGLINLARLQFSLVEDGGEFEKFLRKDFFYYYPWEPWYESVDVERRPLGPAVREFQEEFEFDVGGKAGYSRTLYLYFLKSIKVESYEWGIAGIKYQRFVDVGSPVAPGTEERLFWFDFDLPTPRAYYDVTVYYPDGTKKSEQRIAEFVYGNPDPIR